jgi:hypothetical protein
MNELGVARTKTASILCIRNGDGKSEKNASNYFPDRHKKDHHDAFVSIGVRTVAIAHRTAQKRASLSSEAIVFLVI